MSDGNAAPAANQQPVDRAQQALVDSYIFISDVNETFLLIDHISGRTEKSLGDVETKDIELPVPPAVAPPNGHPSVAEVMLQLCQVGYPPDPDPVARARKAAFVLVLKDRLNALASPARGITIAYTAMFISATDGWWPRLFRRARAAGQPASTRGELARAAYPGLEPHALGFAWLFRLFPLAMFLLLLLTASAYWDVGFGRTIVQHIEQLQQQRNALLYPDSKTAPNGSAVTEAECENPVPRGEAQVCAQLAALDKQIAGVRGDLANFAGATTPSWSQDHLLWLTRIVRPISYGFLFTGQNGADRQSETAVTWVLSLFSTYVLPAMFGLLGTLVAIMRAIQAKVRDSLLSPRDLPLSLLGLAVGVMAGLAVGLYYSPSATPTLGGAGLAGAVSLSASGLGFLAGYGADAFFKFLDALLTRVFALDNSGK